MHEEGTEDGVEHGPAKRAPGPRPRGVHGVEPGGDGCEEGGGGEPEEGPDGVGAHEVLADDARPGDGGEGGREQDAGEGRDGEEEEAGNEEGNAANRSVWSPVQAGGRARRVQRPHEAGLQPGPGPRGILLHEGLLAQLAHRIVQNAGK